MKKIITIIISTILICIIGLGIIGYYVEKDKAEENKEIKTEEKIEKTEEEKKLVIDIDKLDTSKIEGYTPGEEITNEDNWQPDTNSDENINVGGINLPYTIPYKNMEIVSIGEYFGKFVEDGSDEKKENVLAMIIKNTSDEVIDYGEINMKISGKANTFKFKVTNLKPGASALVMESTGKIPFSREDRYIYISSKSNTVKTMSLMEDDIRISTEHKKVTIENLSDKNLNTVYVYYKTVSTGNCYLGGVTYRVKFENVDAGSNLTSNTLHFSNTNSEILKIESVKE